jgi:uncharacterized protein (TIGR03067 family)
MRAHLALGMAALASAAFAPAPLPKPDKTSAQQELKRLEGTWALVGIVRNGKEIAGKALNTNRKVLITKGTWAFLGAGMKAAEYRMVVSTKGKPPTLDLYRGEAKEPTVRGVFVLEGATLKFCYFAPRKEVGPARLRPTGPQDPDPGLMVMTLQREKK